MLTVIAKGLFHEYDLQNVIALYQELISETKKEKGCLSYELYQDIDNPCILTMLEAWENKASLDAHTVSAHFQRIVPEIGKFRLEKDLHVYTKLA